VPGDTAGKAELKRVEYVEKVEVFFFSFHLKESVPPSTIVQSAFFVGSCEEMEGRKT
jgi:hypothetical protein